MLARLCVLMIGLAPYTALAHAEGEEVAGPPPAIAAFGVTAGFPSFQTVAVSISLQAQYVGLQLKGSLTSAGPYFGFQARGYPPVPVPVPLYIGVGAGFYGPNTTVFGVVGAHVPLSLNLRLDVEGGVAQVPLLDKREIVPYVSIGLSYAFPVPAVVGSGSASSVARAVSSTGSTATCTEPGEPDRSGLADAVKSTVRGFIESARATYGSVYADLRYDYDIRGTKVSGDVGTVEIRYSGSVRTIATGQRESAKGVATARYRWNGCSWRELGVEY